MEVEIIGQEKTYTPNEARAYLDGYNAAVRINTKKCYDCEHLWACIDGTHRCSRFNIAVNPNTFYCAFYQNRWNSAMNFN